MDSFCGEVTLAGRSHASSDERAQALRALGALDRSSVRALQLSHYPFGNVDDRPVFLSFVRGLAQFVHLERFRASGCDLVEAQVGLLLGALAGLPRLVELCLSSNVVTHRVFEEVRTSMASVRLFSAMNTPLSDAALSELARIFPNVEALHLAGTLIKGWGVGALVEENVHLRVLGLDRTRLGDVGVRELHEALVERAAPLEVRMRRVCEPSAAWLPLIALAAQPRSKKRLKLKHDLHVHTIVANTLATPPIYVHPKVAVEFVVQGYPPVQIVLRDVPSTRSVVALTSEVVNEFNRFLVYDDTECTDAGLQERRLLYRTAFEKLGDVDALFGQRHVQECALLWWKSCHASKCYERKRVLQPLVGLRRPGQQLCIQVAVAR
tara:strand:- start:3718 stop:4857 length:1140 start_codon:yes stop_codon:yes gene_type:complete